MICKNSKNIIFSKKSDCPIRTVALILDVNYFLAFLMKFLPLTLPPSTSTSTPAR